MNVFTLKDKRICFQIGVLICLCFSLQQTAAGMVWKDTVLVFNAGINGNNTADLLARWEKDVLARNPGLVVLMVGTNDMLNLRNRLSVEQYEKNYQQLVASILPHSKLILMTIPPVNDDYILQRQDPKFYKDASPSSKVNAANAVIRSIAAKNDCLLIDLYRIMQGCGGSWTDKESLFQNEVNAGVNDGVHPTAGGYRVIGTAVFQAVSQLGPNVRSIVCFGDSITFGYNMQGQGTVSGHSYPAVLNSILNEKQQE